MPRAAYGVCSWMLQEVEEELFPGPLPRLSIASLHGDTSTVSLRDRSRWHYSWGQRRPTYVLVISDGFFRRP